MPTQQILKPLPGADIRFRDHAGPDKSRNEVVQFLDFRVFVMGVEVTSYVKDSLSFTRSLNGTENTCSFTLDNSHNRFVLTVENFKNYQDKTDPNATEQQRRNSIGAEQEYNFQQSMNPEHLPYTGLDFNNLADFDESKMHWVLKPGNIVDETPKKELFEYKVKQILEFTQATAHNDASLYTDNSGATIPGAYASTHQLANKFTRYPLTVQSCVINLHDEVRVFVADPNADPVVNGYTRWMPIFSGFVSSVPISDDLLTGASTLSVQCSDIRYMLRKMRITGNIQAVQQVDTYIRFDDAIGLFQDAALLADPSTGEVKYENLAAKLSYRQLTRALLCGDNPSDIAKIDEENRNKNGIGRNVIKDAYLGGYDQHAAPRDEAERQSQARRTFNDPWTGKIGAHQHESDKTIQVRGVGNFSLGHELVCYAAGDVVSWLERASVMEAWQDILNFGVKRTWYTDDEVAIIGGGTKPLVYMAGSSGASDSGSPSPYSVLNGFVHYLFPSDSEADGGMLGIRNLMDRGLINVTSEVQWTNRLDLLVQASDTIDYKIQINGMGDICFEYPMYDYTPNGFGKYAECFALHDSIKSQDINDEGDGQVVSLLQVVGGLKDIDQSSPNAGDQKTVKDQQYSVWIKSDVMASRYGIVPEEHKIPWALDVWALTTTDAAGKEQNNDAAHKNTLVSFGIVEFYKRIAAMSSMSMDFAYNIYIWPNRPLLNKIRRRLGLVDSASYVLAIDGVPTTNVEARWIRKASQADLDAIEGNTYQTITGYVNTPLGYGTSGLKLFTTTALDNIRTVYGFEIIDPKTNKVDDATKSAQQFNGSFNGGFGQQAPVVVGDREGIGLNFSISNNVRRAYRRFEALRTSDAATYNAVVQVAAAAGCEPQDMYVLMEHESGGRTRINPNGYNAGSGAQGIIQFIPSTLKDLQPPAVNIETFRQDYPTVAAQAPFAVKYFNNQRRLYGPLDTPYKLILATFNPASLRDDPFADFATSANSNTRKRADLIKRLNGGISCPADACLAKGYNYFDFRDSTAVVHGKSVKFYSIAQTQPEPPNAPARPGFQRLTA